MRTVRAGPLLILVLLGACRAAAPQGAGRVPPPPTTPQQSLGPTTPPVTWLSGTIQEATTGSFRLQQGDGAVVSVKRLGQGATKLFGVSGLSWERLPAKTTVRSGETVCIETLLDGPNLVALRVFLGAGCGPI